MLVAQWLAHWPLVLDVPGLIPPVGEENLVSEHASFHIICMDDMNTVLRPSDQDLNWRPSVQGLSSPVQIKDPYTGSIVMHVGSS